MRIAGIDVFGYELTYRYGSYVMSGGRSVDRLPSTVVRITTDEGVEGWGETCPLGTTYLAASGEGARTALRELAPGLIGVDPRELALVNEAMDRALRGHAYAKSAVDVACWDILGKSSGQPVTTLLGGRLQESYPLYIAVPLGPVDATVEYVREQAAAGIHRFQLKLGADPREDVARVAAVVDATGEADTVIADANGGWRLQDAVVAARLLEPLPRTFLEQPCASLEECLYVRRLTSLPMVLDEVIVDLQSLLRAWSEDGMEAINLKVSKVGGLTRAKLIRDVADTLGLKVTIEDTWGGDVVTAAVSQLAANTRPETLFTVSFMNDWTNEHVAGYEPRSANGVGGAPTGPGLGIDVDVDLLGEPLFTVR